MHLKEIPLAMEGGGMLTRLCGGNIYNLSDKRKLTHTNRQGRVKANSSLQVFVTTTLIP